MEEKTKVAHTNKKNKQPSQIDLWMFYFKFMKIDWIQFFLVNCIWIISSIVQAHTPFLLLDIKYSLIENDYEKLKQLVIKYLVIQIFTQTIEYYELRYHWYSYQKKKQCIQKSIISHLFSLDLSFFEDNKVTSLSKTVQEGTDQISEQLSYGKIARKINQYIEVFSQLYFIYYQSGRILLLLLIIGFISSILYQYINWKKIECEKNQNEQNEYKDFALDDIIQNIQLIKIFRNEKREIANMEEVIKVNNKNTEQNEYYKQMKRICFNCSHDILKISVIIQIIIGVISVEEQKYLIANTIAEVISYVYSVLVLTKDITKLFNSTFNKDTYNSKFKYIVKLVQLFDQHPSIRDIDQELPKNLPVQFLKGNIEFSNVTFKYPISNDVLARRNQQFRKKELESNGEEIESLSNTSESSEESFENTVQDETNDNIKEDQIQQNDRSNVLTNISFKIQSGQFVAFVGMSGSGKSTIVKLMERYYDVNEGNILFDGQNIKDISLNNLRGSIGLVSQEPSLFDNDIEYNITYGCQNGEYTKEELIQICDVSGVSEFVLDENRFPQGLKTLVGSKGMKLSGGQKQRIAIARALIKKPTILILDEATSSLDSESENLVQKYIDKLVGYRGITIIVIAHRLSTIVKSDVIFVMQHGQIKESGKHVDLIAKQGVYHKLIQHQIDFSNQSINQS